MSFWRLVILWVLLGINVSEFVCSADVTLDSISIFKTHEWLGAKPSVYFLCKGENKTHLPDVKEANVSYTFKGQESWQPLTNFTNNKCKRCGLYEEDDLSSDDVFGEWEFCPSEFSRSNGKYEKLVKDEFTATFLCHDCSQFSSGVDPSSDSEKSERMSHIAIATITILVVTSLLGMGLYACFKYWQRRKREQDQARFLKLFEDGDDIEDELGLGTVV